MRGKERKKYWVEKENEKEENEKEENEKKMQKLFPETPSPTGQ